MKSHGRWIAIHRRRSEKVRPVFCVFGHVSFSCLIFFLLPFHSFHSSKDGALLFWFFFFLFFLAERISGASFFILFFSSRPDVISSHLISLDGRLDPIEQKGTFLFKKKRNKMWSERIETDRHFSFNDDGSTGDPNGAELQNPEKEEKTKSSTSRRDFSSINHVVTGGIIFLLFFV